MFQMRSWHRTTSIALTERKMEALVLFFTRSLMNRWSLMEASQAEDGLAPLLWRGIGSISGQFFELDRAHEV